MADDKKGGDSEQHINLKVMGQDNAIVQFRIKKHTPLRKLMNAYCTRTDLAMAAVRFRFDGQPINEADTPLSLEMEEGDTIEVYQQQTGGVSGGETDHINLKVMGQDNAIVQFRIKKHSPLRKLMNAYCERAGLAMAAVRFRFDGQPINEADTPMSLEMEDGDTIEIQVLLSVQIHGADGMNTNVVKLVKKLAVEIALEAKKKSGNKMKSSAKVAKGGAIPKVLRQMKAPAKVRTKQYYMSKLRKVTAPPKDAQARGIIVLTVYGLRTKVKFLVKRTQALKKLKKIYCLINDTAVEDANFRYKGITISNNHRPLDLSMKDGDTICATHVSTLLFPN